MVSVDSVSVRWRVEDRAFLLSASVPGPARLVSDDGRELSLSAEEWCALGDVLFRIGADWPGHTCDTGFAAAGTLDAAPAVAFESSAPVAAAPRASPVRRGLAWTDEEELRLLAAFDAGDEVADIARALSRTRSGVTARLVRLGRIAESAANLRWPPKGPKESAGADSTEPAPPGLSPGDGPAALSSAE